MLPLISAIVIAIVQSEALADSSREAMVSVQTSTDISRQLESRVRDLERAARQYIALNDLEILTLYRERRREVQELLAVLRNVNSSTGNIASTLEAIADAERGVQVLVESRPARDSTPPVTYAVPDGELLSRENVPPPVPRSDAMPASASRQESPAASSTNPTVISRSENELEQVFERLRESARELLALYSLRGQVLANELPRQTANLRTFIGVLAAMVIPLSLALGAIFLALASRPLRQLDSGVRALGGGDLQSPIEIRGARDLVVLGERLDWLRTRLIALEAQKTRFLRNVSHELKTPLTNIREASGLLLAGPEMLRQEESATVMRILHDNGLRLQALIEELLRFGANEGDSQELRHTPLAMRSLVLETVDRQSIAARARNISLHSELTAVEVSGNYRELETIVDNLLSNAIKFTPQGGEVRLQLSTQDGEVHLDVKDTGPGVAQEHSRAIFDWFFRASPTTKSVLEGTGMGLAIAMEYARKHRGSLELMPSAKGAYFRLSLPVMEGSR